MTMPSYSRYQHDDQEDREQSDPDPIETQAEQAQRQKVDPNVRTSRSDLRWANPRRRLGLEMIKQAKKDLEAHLYKGKDPEPHPVRWIWGEGLEKACALGEVSVRRVRRQMQQIIDEASGPLEGRRFASLQQLRQDDHEWLTCEQVAARFGVRCGNTASQWCSKGHVTCLKAREGESGAWHWRVRVDSTLRDKVTQYSD
jgi:hypothetical protein